MAIWQFDVELVPREPIIERFGYVPTELADFDDEWVWSCQPPSDYTAVIESIARPYPSWSSAIQMWGAENGDRIHVLHEGAQVVGIACRIDLRAFSADFVKGLLRLALHCDCLLLVGGSTLIPPTWDSILEAVRISDELRFVSDPLKFLDGLSGNDA